LHVLADFGCDFAGHNLDLNRKSISMTQNTLPLQFPPHIYDMQVCYENGVGLLLLWNITLFIGEIMSSAWRNKITSERKHQQCQ
jgi:hypothetical protein